MDCRARELALPHDAGALSMRRCAARSVAASRAWRGQRGRRCRHE
jgi:hypothetical protein